MPTATARTPSAPVAFAAAAVLLQIAYPLVEGQTRHGLTVLTVVVLLTASASHALVHRGPRWTAQTFGVLVGLGLLAEAVGVATGYPFGSYSYGDSLGPELLGVPLVVPLAWGMLGYPCLLAGQRLSSGAGGAALGAVGLAGWDLFLDPQLVAERHWSWADPTPGLNGIPLTNLAGWLLVALLMMLLVPRAPAADDLVPHALLLWTYASSVLANLVFFGRPGVALAGGLGMGLLVVPLALALARDA